MQDFCNKGCRNNMGQPAFTLGQRRGYGTVNGKSKTVDGQRGSALILVLIALALGSLIITPTLNYVSTGLLETRVSEEMLLDLYSADAAVEYSLWQLKYDVDGLADQLNPENPSSNTTITVNGVDISITTEISQSFQDDTGVFPVLPSESGIHLAVALQILTPSWTSSGQIAYLTHVVYIYNYGTSAAHLKTLSQQLDPDLLYVEWSYEGPVADLTVTAVDDHSELYFDFTEPLPALWPQETVTITFIASAVEDMGEHNYLFSGNVTHAGFEEEGVLYSGGSGITSFGLYDITVTVGSYTYLVNVGITEEGEIVLRSWQLQ